MRQICLNTILPLAPLLDVSFEEAQRVFNTNFWGLIRLVTHIVPRMAQRRQGTVVAVGSILGEIGTPFQGFYNASKAALHAYTETLVSECKPLGVRVMLLVPGSVRSNISNVRTPGLFEFLALIHTFVELRKILSHARQFAI